MPFDENLDFNEKSGICLQTKYKSTNMAKTIEIEWEDTETFPEFVCELMQYELDSGNAHVSIIDKTTGDAILEVNHAEKYSRGRLSCLGNPESKNNKTADTWYWYCRSHPEVFDILEGKTKSNIAGKWLRKQ